MLITVWSTTVTDLIAVLSLTALLITAVLVTRALRPRGYLEAGLWLTLILTTSIVLLGYAVSELRVLADVRWWALLNVGLLVITVLVVHFIPALHAACLRPLGMPRPLEAMVQQADKRSFAARVVIGLGIVVGLVALGNLALIMGAEPSNYDALSHHIARIGHFLHANTLDIYDLNYWASAVQPKVATVLMLYTYLVSGQQANLLQLVQFLAFFVTIGALYGITRRLGVARKASLFAALLFGLLTIVITEAATAQHDLVMTAFIACTVYALTAYRQSRAPRDLVMAALAFALAAGVQATAFSFVPPLLLIAAWALWPVPGHPVRTARHLGIALAALAGWLAIITLPAGYLGTQRHFGHPFGPPQVRAAHGFTQLSPGALLRYGTLNMARYGIESFALDGMPAILGLHRVNSAVQGALIAGAKSVRLQVDGMDGARRRMGHKTTILANEESSGWGVLGFLLIWPVTLLALATRRWPVPARVFAGAMVIAVITHAFSSPYAWDRGGFLMTTALFALPVLGCIFPPRRTWLRGALVGILILGSLSALTTTLYRRGTPLVPFYTGKGWIPSVFTHDRSAQLTRQFANFPLLEFNALVPEDAVIAIDSRQQLPEYLFFGDGFSRRLVGLSPVTENDTRALPANATALIYDEHSAFRRPGDIILSAKQNRRFVTLYLRMLHPSEEQRTFIQMFGGDPDMMEKPTK